MLFDGTLRWLGIQAKRISILSRDVHIVLSMLHMFIVMHLTRLTTMYTHSTIPPLVDLQQPALSNHCLPVDYCCLALDLRLGLTRYVCQGWGAERKRTSY